jgi:hypothetical protein
MRAMKAHTPRRRRLRFAIVALVCLILGAVTTVGVAWCGVLYWPDERLVPDVSGAIPSPPRWEPRGENATRHTQVRSWGRHTDAWWTEGQSAYATKIERTGWPALAMWSGKTREDVVPVEQRRPGARLVGMREGILLVADMRYRPGQWMMFHYAFVDANGRGNLGHAQLPVLPLFPGFVVDTALYSLVWYLLIFTPPQLYRAGRRRFRVSKGLCSACAYDLKGAANGPCPECGNAPGPKS